MTTNLSQPTVNLLRLPAFNSYFRWEVIYNNKRLSGNAYTEAEAQRLIKEAENELTTNNILLQDNSQSPCNDSPESSERQNQSEI